jgi:hypothetical protein
MGSISQHRWITYEDHGATGDGITDDLPAICKAHEVANTHGLSVRTKPDAAYYLGSRALTAVIATDTDWNTSRFLIDDRQVEDHKTPLFKVCSLANASPFPCQQIQRGQNRFDVSLDQDCMVYVENENIMRYKRRGLNVTSGNAQNDCFILRRDGSVEGDIDWDYPAITHSETCPLDAKPINLRGGVFTTFANRMKQETGYNYWWRNIVVRRSHVEIQGLTHYVVGETAVGHPYIGFVNVEKCADITLRDCFFSGHKIYQTIGAAGQPVDMGSYDVYANNVVNFKMIGCRMNLICDRTRWGVIATNFCKNILLEDCELSRMDTHMGVSGSYTIKGCRIGWMGVNAIGRGQLAIEDTELNGDYLVCFRGDYGSTWEGDLLIRNCRWTPSCGDKASPQLIGAWNDGMHDFGYPCFMPHKVTIDGLVVDDRNHPEDYRGLSLFSDTDYGYAPPEGKVPMANRPFPYAFPREVSIRGLTALSGMKTFVSPNTELLHAIAAKIQKSGGSSG